ncbi:Nramp family divalent metal transporter [Planctomyces sp. SH-PL62]|uniref:Nramp family divalent metal transporter n=1 Tax=Planctomyces sp. SH-PL62 TaxID=1636152 RepID=UPI00078D36C7|nr:Nramp family divalent metal transporter [Planctomyces sp. SH-PL62]AMV36123.1 Divalent metal cation transporter MntH [Planctomyces sp. SH-PL62]
MAAVEDVGADRRSLEDVHGSVDVPTGGGRFGRFRRMFSFMGPAYLVSVGYMDPGNWATDLEGGARFGYALLWVLLMSNVMALLLQTLAARLGVVTRHDLAQACRAEYSPRVNATLWVLAEIAIAATDLAEILGTIIALKLMFGMPMLLGCAITAFDTFLLLYLQRWGMRKMEAVILALVATIGACFLIQVFMAQPDLGGMAAGLKPSLPPGSLFVAIGILGATVMPHNLYLHSALVQTRRIGTDQRSKATACRYYLFDSTIALNAAFFVNAAILVLSAAVFHANGREVATIEEAYELLPGFLGAAAPILFGVALLCAGQSSTLTGTLAGQIVMEGYLHLRIAPWLRRLITRMIALIPAVVVIALAGERSTQGLLVLSQVILSLQLSFAVIPLIHFTSDRRNMGAFATPWWGQILAWSVAAVIVALNGYLVYGQIEEWILAASASGIFLGPIPLVWPVAAGLVLLTGSVVALLCWVLIKPIVRPSPPWRLPSRTEMDWAEALRPRSLGRIGVALEHTAADVEILNRAISLAESQGGGAELVLLHVVDSPLTALHGPMTADLETGADAEYLDSLVRVLTEKGYRAQPALLYGPDPARVLIEHLGERPVDILVVGSHGHGWVRDLLYGETVDRVRHSLDVPMLIARHDPQASAGGGNSGETDGITGLDPAIRPIP